jgi:hypothetical protein
VVASNLVALFLKIVGNSLLRYIDLVGGRENELRKKPEEKKAQGRKRMIGGVEVTQINLLNGGDMMISAKNLENGQFDRIKTKVIYLKIFHCFYINKNLVCCFKPFDSKPIRY